MVSWHSGADVREEQKLLTASAKNMLTEISDLFKKLDQDSWFSATSDPAEMFLAVILMPQDQNEVIVMEEWRACLACVSVLLVTIHDSLKVPAY